MQKSTVKPREQYNATAPGLPYHMLLPVLVASQQVHRLHVPKVNVVPQQIYVDELAHIFLPLVPVNTLFCGSIKNLFLS